MVEVPARELARGNPAWNCIDQPQQALGERVPPLKDRVVHDFVQQDGEIENRESLDDGQGQPYQRILEIDQCPGSESEDGELAHGNDEMADS